jgi:cholesterol oxidase
VSSLIFSIDTIETNLLESLIAAGYDCWLLDYRASVDLSYARELWTGDDVATKDYPAAVAKVRAVTGAPTVQMVAHCFGATTFSMAMLAGLDGVRSAVISQIATDYVVPWFPQRLLAYLRAPVLFEAMGIDVVDARATSADILSGRSTRCCSSSCRCRARSARTTPPATASARSTGASTSSISSTAHLSSGSPRCSGEANIDAFKQLAVRAARPRLSTAMVAIPTCRTWTPGAADHASSRRQERVLQAGEHGAHASTAVASERPPAL